MHGQQDIMLLFPNRENRHADKRPPFYIKGGVPFLICQSFYLTLLLPGRKGTKVRNGGINFRMAVDNLHRFAIHRMERCSE